MGNRIFYIAVCDDEIVDLHVIKTMTEELCKEHHIECEIQCFDGAKSFMNSIRNGTVYDLLLVDVMMPDQDGMELARLLQEKENAPKIVFLSNNREMAMRGYEVNAVRYLAKPVNRSLLQEALLHCYKRYCIDGELLIPFDKVVRKVKPEDIQYVEINGRKGHIVQKDSEWDSAMSMRELEELLPSQSFIRCHQSFLVNCRYIRTLKYPDIELTTGKRIPVSKHRIKTVRNAFFDYIRS